MIFVFLNCKVCCELPTRLNSNPNLKNIFKDNLCANLLLNQLLYYSPLQPANLKQKLKTVVIKFHIKLYSKIGFNNVSYLIIRIFHKDYCENI